MSLPDWGLPITLTPEQQLQYAIDNGYPLQKAPAGIVPDFDNGTTTAYQLYITAGICIPLMLVFSLIRLLNAIKFARKTFIIDESKLLCHKWSIGNQAC